MQVRALGDLEVVDRGGALDLGGPKPRTLFALLLVGEGRPVAVEHLIDQIWGEEPPAQVEASLQSYVARLRRLIEPERRAGTRPSVLRTHAGGYSLQVPDDDVDTRRFTSLLRQARTTAEHDPTGAEATLARALDLWRGDAYSGLAGSALASEALRLGELRANAQEDLWDLRIRHGRHPEAVGALEQLVAAHPLRERMWGLLARALYRDDRQGDALAALRRARDLLADELGVDPGPELRLVEELVLRQDPALDPAPPPGGVATQPVAGAASPETETAGTRLGDTDDVTASATTPADRPGEPETLFGREALLDDLGLLLQEAVEQRRGRLVLVSGEPGIGKTSLLRSLVARAAALGMRCGRGSWDTEGVPALWGWRSAVSEVLGTAEVLDAPREESVDAASVSFRQADSLVAALRGDPATLLVLDDVHWADADSLRLLRRVSSHTASVPLVLVVGLRSSEADRGPTVTSTLAALARVDPVRVELAGLDATAVSAWVQDRAGVRVSPEVAGALVDRSGGNPLYVGELVRLLVRHGALASLEAPAWGSVPDNVRDLVRDRVGALPDESTRVLGTAAVAGRSFDLLVVERACGSDAALVDAAVESALMLGLVEAEEGGRYRFTHALVRDALYEMVPAPTRARAHGSVATALESRYAGSVGSHVTELAEHYRLAGPALARSAWLFASRAAAAAASASADDEALRLHALAEQLQASDPAVTSTDREPELVAQAVAMVRLGHPLQAWPKVAAAARSALARGDVDAAASALLTITTGAVWGWRQTAEYDDDAIRLWERVLDLLPVERAATRAQVKAAIASELLYRPGAAGRATRLADAAVDEIRRCGAPDPVRLHVLRLAFQAMLRPDLLDHRLPLGDEVVRLADSLGDASALSGSLLARASDLVELGRLAEARADVDRATDLARRHRLPQVLVVAGWTRATLHQLDGDHAGAEALIDETAALDATLTMAGLGIGLYKRAVLRLEQGRLAELEPELSEAADRTPLFGDLHALALLEAGRPDEARRRLGAWSDQPPLPWNYLWLGFTVLRARLWCRLGDAAALASLRSDLAPYASRVGTGALAVAFLGAVELALGELAAAAGDPAAAREHLLRARAVHEELGLRVWVDRTDRALRAVDAS